jgi:hypothetical protein
MSGELVSKSVPDAIQALRAMGDDLDSAKTFDEIRAVKRKAEALKHFFEEVERVRGVAELIVILAERRIGEELAKMPKARPGRRRKIGNNELPIFPATQVELVGSRMAASRLKRLAAAPEEKVRSAVEAIVASGKSATVTAVLREVEAPKVKRQGVSTSQRAVIEAGSAAAVDVRRYVVELTPEIDTSLGSWIAERVGDVVSPEEAIRLIVEREVRRGVPPRPPRPSQRSASG